MATLILTTRFYESTIKPLTDLGICTSFSALNLGLINQTEYQLIVSKFGMLYIPTEHEFYEAISDSFLELHSKLSQR